MTPEPLQNSQQLEQDYQAVLAALRDEKNRQISEYQAQAWKMAQRANEAEQRAEHFKVERDARQAELSSLKTDMFVLNNDMGYTTGVLEDVLKQRDALQARIDGALMPLKSVAGVARHWAKYSGSADKSDLGCVVVKAIEILTGEGE